MVKRVGLGMGLGRGSREEGVPNPILALKFSETSASCCLFQNKEESVHGPLAIVQSDNVYALHFGIFSWTDSTTCIPKVKMSYTPAKIIKKSCRGYSINMITIQTDHRISRLLDKTTCSLPNFYRGLNPVDIKVERKLFILPLALTLLDTSITGGKRVESSP